MQGWLVALGPADGRRVTPGGHVFDSVTDVGLAGLPVDSVIQTGGGVGGMLMAGVIVIVLGLTAVAVWQGHASTLVDRLLDRRRSTGSTPVEPAEGGATDSSGVESEAAEPPATDAVELSDKDVIVDILEDNDGRMKQARIVDATGWSKSKVSMLLSEMEDDGDITKLRVGRENIISLRGNEPDAAGSPFDSQ